jgi:hypothetical protein
MRGVTALAAWLPPSRCRRRLASPWRDARRLALVLGAALSGCAPLPSTPAKPPIGPEIVVRLSETGRPARDLLERVAAGCWLDGVVRGAALVVDRQTGRVIIVSDDHDLLAADFLSSDGGQSRVRLSGPVIADPVKRQRLVETLDLAVRTGETSCPIATG